MQPSASRLLAPAPAPAPVSDPTQQPGHSPLDPASPTSSNTNANATTISHTANGNGQGQYNNLITGIRRASTACRSCKQIKRKCDQAQPCSNCRKSHTECVYNEAEDGRRKAARKRTVETLELKRDALDSILESFRSSSDAHAQDLLSLIKAGAPLDEIVRHATIYGDDNDQGHFEAIASLIEGLPRKNVMSVTALCDTPLFQVRAEPWTTVTRDDEFVSHLVSVFFTWYHPAYPSIHKDLFLRDMNAGDLNCQFCSPALVNAVLGLACNFSDHPLSCEVPSNGTTRGQHFFREAVRLWQAEEEKPTLLNLQTASILAVAACLIGKDRLSWSYLQCMNEMYQMIAAKRVRTDKLGLASLEIELRQSEDLAAWTGFLLTVGFGVAFMRHSSYQMPATGPLIETPVQLWDWVPYPQQYPESTFPFNALHKAYCTLHCVGFDIQAFLFGSPQVPKPRDAAALDQELAKWRAELPESLQLDVRQNTMSPPIVDLHLSYHFFRIALFSLLKDTELTVSLHSTTEIFPAPAPSTSRPSANVPRRSNPSSDNVEDHSEPYSQSQIRESAKEIAAICRQYTRQFGLKQTTMWMPQASASAIYSLLDPATDLHQEDMMETFHELCLVVISASRKWLVMRGHVRMILITARDKGQTLPLKIESQLKSVAVDQWSEGDHKMFASSAYPNYAFAKDDDPRLNGMGDLLETWANVQFELGKSTNSQTAIGKIVSKAKEGFAASTDTETIEPGEMAIRIQAENSQPPRLPR